MNEENNKEITPKKDNLTFVEILKFTILTLIVVIPIRMFVAEPYLVRGTSMDPTFKNNDYLIVEKISKNIERGEVIIFKSPVDNRNLIKRVIGLPGETVLLKSGKFQIKKTDGQLQTLSENYILYQDLDKTVDIKLNEDQYFVSGDNRAGSYDSRYWGALPKKNILGKPFLRLFHFNSIGIWPGNFSI
jgi:signal peptidase I